MKSILFLPYFGNIEFYHILKNSEEAVFEVWDTYPKQTFRNRTQILGANGPLNLSIPVIKPNGSKSKTREIKIDYSEDWQKNHLKSIESAYKNSPFYDYYDREIMDLINSKEELLIEKNLKLVEFVSKTFSIDTNTSISDTYIKESDFENYRERLSPKRKSDFKTPSYIQVFSDRFEFQNNLSILDLLFNEGPNAVSFL